MMQDPWVVGKKFRSFPSNFFTQPFQYFQIANLVDCLSSWYKFIMNYPSNIKKSQQHCFDSWFGLMEFFWTWGIGSLPLCTLLLRFRVVLVHPCFITCDDTAQNVILSLQKVLANCDSSLLLFFGELLWEGPFLHTPSSCQDLQLRFSWMFLCWCSVTLLCSWQSANNFHTQFDKFLQCFLQFYLLLAILISLCQ